MRIYTRRRLVNAVTLTVSMFTMLFGLFWLIWILITLALRGAARLDWAMLSQMTPPPGQSGGVLNALVGSLLITLVAVVIGTPVGILAGTYLAEFGRGSRLAEVIRFVNDILLSAPSIILGLFVYETVVLTMGHFSGWAGACALALIVIPVVVRTTENILRLVPDTLREAAAALGTPQWLIVTKVVYRAGRAGILTGVLLAIARISGETAPLLFTSLNNQFWSTDLGHPIASLPIIIFQFAMSPYQDWQQLAWAAALMITLAVLALNIIARTFVSRNEGA